MKKLFFAPILLFAVSACEQAQTGAHIPSEQVVETTNCDVAPE